MIKEIFGGIFKLIYLLLSLMVKGIKYFFKTGYKLYKEFSVDYKRHKKMAEFSQSSRNEIL